MLQSANQPVAKNEIMSYSQVQTVFFYCFTRQLNSKWLVCGLIVTVASDNFLPLFLLHDTLTCMRHTVYKPNCKYYSVTARFFAKHITDVWNSLQFAVNSILLLSFRRSISLLIWSVYNVSVLVPMLHVHISSFLRDYDQRTTETSSFHVCGWPNLAATASACLIRQFGANFHRIC